MQMQSVIFKKRAATSLIASALIISSLLPISFIAALIFDLRLIVSFFYDILTYALFLMISAALFLLCKTDKTFVKASSHMVGALCFTCLLNLLCCLILKREIMPLFGSGLCFAASIVIFARFAGTSRLSWIFCLMTLIALISALALLPSVLIGNLLVGKTSVLSTVESPERTYAAQVVSSDEGALGGSTFVEVYRPEKTLNLLIVRFDDMPRQIYRGDYIESQTINIKWKDEYTLLINGREYLIDEG